MLPFSTLLRISRPRFWHYVLGPMLIFFASIGLFKDTMSLDSFLNGGTDRIFSSICLFIFLGYFTLPANLWIYGWNDIADGDTDKFNSKKGSYEEKIENSDIMKKKLKNSIWIWNIGYILFFVLCFFVCAVYQREGSLSINEIILAMQEGVLTIILWIIAILSPFSITSYLYSCRPLRAKAKPFIDGIMNVLYVIVPFTVSGISIALNNHMYEPGIETMIHKPRTLYICNFLAALFRCMAMHCYSAIPDIEPDRQAGLNTTAVYLGKQKSLIYCVILYLLSAILSFPTLGWFSIVSGIVYITMMIISYTKKDVFGLYKMFPWINLVVGFLLFRYVILAF